MSDFRKTGWIFIGEIEFKYNPFNKYRDDEPVFMYTKYFENEDGNITYYYGFGRGINDPTYLGYFSLDKRYSITTVLQSFISHDLQFRDFEGWKIQSCNSNACRLAGLTEWIFPNEKYLNKEIELDDLEKFWRTDKEKKQIDEYMKNEFASKENKERILKEGRYYKI